MAYATWSLATLERFCTDVFEAFGFDKTQSDQISDVLLTADLYGIESHGMQRMVRYHKGLEKGQIHRDAQPERGRTHYQRIPADAGMQGGQLG